MDYFCYLAIKHATLWHMLRSNRSYLIGWMSNGIWLNSSQLINGYNLFCMNNLAVFDFDICFYLDISFGTIGFMFMNLMAYTG